jgi:hypothetical protein
VIGIGIDISIGSGAVISTDGPIDGLLWQGATDFLLFSTATDYIIWQ